MKKQILAVVTLVIAGVVAGCGSDTAPATVAGKVADGYLERATVFLDKNGNYLLDAGEPFAITDANGSYTLSVDPADIGGFPIVALAIKDVTIDRDTNLPVANSYVLSMPRQNVSGTANSNFISPLTTQVREMMETGNYANMQLAMEELRLNLDLPAGTNMLGDYIAGQNTTLHTAAQNMATVMGAQMTQLFDSTGSATSIDVNRYRGMMGTMFSNMSSVRTSSSPTTMTELMNTMTSNVSNIRVGLPYQNMSSYFRGGYTVGGTRMMGSSIR